ncbi:hypothetical protein KLEA5_gp02 [Aeromonas phage vB_AveS_KLEA5]|nr:hypothetical protein KLEA5_gp02 [Aeromonas phage vB_AveS_KLEA5]
MRLRKLLMTDLGIFEMSRLSDYLYGQGLTDDEIKELITEATPIVTLPKAHQFYTTYSRAGYFREDVIRALNDAGIKYREQE